MSIKRVVVVGAFGFIGDSLCKKLLAENIAVEAIGRKQIDLTQTGAGQTLGRLLQPGDTVVILSAITPDKGKTRLDFLNNLRIGMAICEAFSQVPPAYVVYLSSDAVYSFDTPLINEKSLAAPADLYGAMHRSRELLLESLQLPLWVVRPTIIYGAGDTHNSYGPNRFIRQALAERSITLFGGGEETRSHISVDDVVSLIIRGIKKQYKGLTNAVTEPSYTFKEIAELIVKLVPFPVNIQEQPRKSPITHRHFDTSALIRDFPDWEPMGINTGLSKMLEKLSQEASYAT
jgi:nucleoside-diphosphate-sugar epimerase